MSIQHEVQQGKCLSGIGKRYGFADWKGTIATVEKTRGH